MLKSEPISPAQSLMPARTETHQEGVARREKLQTVYQELFRGFFSDPRIHPVGLPDDEGKVPFVVRGAQGKPFIQAAAGYWVGNPQQRDECELAFVSRPDKNDKHCLFKTAFYNGGVRQSREGTRDYLHLPTDTPKDPHDNVFSGVHRIEVTVVYGGGHIIYKLSPAQDLRRYVGIEEIVMGRYNDYGELTEIYVRQEKVGQRTRDGKLIRNGANFFVSEDHTTFGRKDYEDSEPILPGHPIPDPSYHTAQNGAIDAVRIPFGSVRDADMRGFVLSFPIHRDYYAELAQAQLHLPMLNHYTSG